MKIHGICLVKNEADILEYSLGEAARWCDRIYVFDNGSTDGTWELVQTLAGRIPQIVPFIQDGRPFDNALRGAIFNHFRHEAQPHDWWCRLDADEVYVENPKAFLSEVPPAYHVVWAAHLQFYLTEEDLNRFEPEDYERPPKITAQNLPKYYLANASEGRFFRHRSGLIWAGGAWPRHLGLVFPKRIRVRHYQYRSPAQVQQRLNTRHQAIAEGNLDFPHIVESNWRATLVAKPLHREDGSGTYVINESQLPAHMEPVSRRVLKRVMHGIGIWP